VHHVGHQLTWCWKYIWRGRLFRDWWYDNYRQASGIAVKCAQSIKGDTTTTTLRRSWSICTRMWCLEDLESIGAVTRPPPPPPTENEKERERGCGPWLHKVYNVIAVVDFTVRVMEEYYCTRLSDFANGCVSAQQLLAEKLQTKASYLSDCDQITIISQQLASSEWTAQSHGTSSVECRWKWTDNNTYATEYHYQEKCRTGEKDD